MAKFARFAFASALIAFTASSIVHAHGSEDHGSEADETEEVSVACDETLAANVTTTIDNTELWDTCVTGSTFDVTNLFGVLNFTDDAFLTFCNSSACMGPVHKLIHEIPAGCLITYSGEERNFSQEVSALHDRCHEALDAAELEMAGMDSASSSGSTAESVGASASGSGSSAASTVALSSNMLVVAVAAVSTVASLVL